MIRNSDEGLYMQIWVQAQGRAQVLKIWHQLWGDNVNLQVREQVYQALLQSFV